MQKSPGKLVKQPHGGSLQNGGVRTGPRLITTELRELAKTHLRDLAIPLAIAVVQQATDDLAKDPRDRRVQPREGLQAAEFLFDLSGVAQLKVLVEEDQPVQEFDEAALEAILDARGRLN